MKGYGQAISHGAISIVNAISTGKGGALGIDLWTRAKVTLSDGQGGISGFIASDPGEPTALITTVVKKTLEFYGHHEPVTAEVITTSNIPIAVGLKSSSAAANAVALATASALGEKPGDDELVNIGVEAAIETGVSITGAYDDAYTSYNGGAVLTDNARRRVEKTLTIPSNLRVIILVPSRKTRTGSLARAKFSPIRGVCELAYREASNGRVWDALTLNGLANSSVLGEDPRPAIAALEAGALGAGLTGTGPAIVAIADETHSVPVSEELSRFEGKILLAQPNSRRAEVEE